jgi:hypothetical protein
MTGDGMQTSFEAGVADQVLGELRKANMLFMAAYPGEGHARQPVHTMYGGAQIFKADTAAKLGATALASLDEYAPNFVEFARALGFEGSGKFPRSPKEIALLTKHLQRDPDRMRMKNRHAWLAFTVYTRVIEKLKSEPVEDFRIDFEDGYGNRPDEEEDQHAVFTAKEVAKGMAAGSLPPFIGIRLKPFTEELKLRGVRTLDIVVSTLLRETGGRLPQNFVVTLPKVAIPEHVTALADLMDVLESRHGLSRGALKIELMVETPQSIINSRGKFTLPVLVGAAEGRCIAAHFGVYDYTASCGITAAYQTMAHPACDFARHVMKVSLGGTGIWLSDGATNIMPVGHHRAARNGRPLTAKQKSENREVVHRAWKLAFHDINHSLLHGFYQGWDLHPAQLPVRYAAVYKFFLEGLNESSIRLKTFMEKAAQATLIGDVFDDAATGQGLLNFFLRGIGCQAITEDEARKTGLSLEELRSRSFARILKARRELQ